MKKRLEEGELKKWWKTRENEKEEKTIIEKRE